MPAGIEALPASMSYGGTQYLTSTTIAAMQALFDAAAKAGYVLTVNSGYRSYSDQVYTYNYWVQTQGREYADRTSAHPGHSEHQLGTTADVGTDGHVLEDFSSTPAAAWLAANSWTYGFIVSYPPGTESITGYADEPWHIRYVGVGVAASFHASGLTLHAYLLR
ncbi:MAG: M15 family metallopeptidase [Tepidiformaceae bacterium]